jgi:pyruvate kinase
VHDVKSGDTLLLNDGRMTMRVDRVNDRTIDCTVTVGGVLSDRKGINRQGGGLSAPALTAKDMDDVKSAVAFEADFIAVSFPRNASDMYMARELARAAGGRALMIAKIERYEAIGNLEEILKASDGIMVARGDLAVEVGDAAVPALQKRMIRMARELNKLTITATQMMESMIESPVPTRAEVSDVANAVIDGTDAVMLSAETAAGKYPVETVAAMARVCDEADRSGSFSLDQAFLNRTFGRIDQAIAMAALFTAAHMKVKAICALTQSGSTALWMSRLDSGVPVYALTPEEGTRRRMSLYREVHPVLMTFKASDRENLLLEAEQKLVDLGVVQKGDLVLMTIGTPIGKSGGTNTLKMIRVGEQS